MSSSRTCVQRAGPVVRRAQLAAIALDVGRESVPGDPVQRVVAGGRDIAGGVEQLGVALVLGLAGRGVQSTRNGVTCQPSVRGLVVGGQDGCVGDHPASGLQHVALEVDRVGGDQPGLVVVADGLAEQVAGAGGGPVGGRLAGVAARRRSRSAAAG